MSTLPDQPLSPPWAFRRRGTDVYRSRLSGVFRLRPGWEGDGIDGLAGEAYVEVEEGVDGAITAVTIDDEALVDDGEPLDLRALPDEALDELRRNRARE